VSQKEKSFCKGGRKNQENYEETRKKGIQENDFTQIADSLFIRKAGKQEKSKD
jgi:hypothetical protein